MGGPVISAGNRQGFIDMSNYFEIYNIYLNGSKTAE